MGCNVSKSHDEEESYNNRSKFRRYDDNNHTVRTTSARHLTTAQSRRLRKNFPSKNRTHISTDKGNNNNHCNNHRNSTIHNHALDHSPTHKKQQLTIISPQAILSNDSTKQPQQQRHHRLHPFSPSVVEQAMLPDAALATTISNNVTKNDDTKDDKHTIVSSNIDAVVCRASKNNVNHSARPLQNVFAVPMSVLGKEDDINCFNLAEHVITSGREFILTDKTDGDDTNNTNNDCSQQRVSKMTNLDKKSDADIEFLREKLKEHYLFESLNENELNRLITEFEPYQLYQNVTIATTTNTSTNLSNNLENHNFIIIRQGDWVTAETAYFYIVYEGICNFIINNTIVGEPARYGDCFGELALLYNSPRAATVVAMTSITNVKLFRIHQKIFRTVLQQENNKSPNQWKLNLLNNVPFLHCNKSTKKQDINYVSVAQRQQLANSMIPKLFERNEVLVRRGNDMKVWTVIQHGQVRITNIGDKNEKYQDILLTDGEAFGERTLLLGRPVVFDIIADTDGFAFTIDKHIFKSVLSNNLNKIVETSIDIKKLKGIPLFIETVKGSASAFKIFSYLASQMKDASFVKGFVLCYEGKPFLAKPALYFVRKGTVCLTKTNADGSTKETIINEEEYFGDDQLFADVDPAMVAQYTATCICGTCILGILKLQSCRKVFNTREIGKCSLQNMLLDSLSLIPGTELTINDFKRRTILGAGTFGQVWLASRRNDSTDNDNNYSKSNNNCETRIALTGQRKRVYNNTRIDTSGKCAYALKIQSKYELVKHGQAKGVINEKNIMEELHHPFVGGLIASFQDRDFVYMVMPLIQGGELYGVMNRGTSRMDEKDAVFYISCITEGLVYLHRRGFVYRDLKPENVLIDRDGYPVIIDFGFTKYVPYLTFTLCGTPLYIAPEVILNCGHNYGADHWSLGCLIYELLCGYTPFYKDGMTQSDLFRAIVKGSFDMPLHVSDDGKSIIVGLLQRHRSRRLGNLSGGFDDLLYHTWLSLIDHEMLLLKDIKAPILPTIVDPFDASNFEDWSHQNDKAETKYPPLDVSEENIFCNF